MKARPILFSSPMIRALFGGIKTQTRRVMNPQPRPGRNGDGTIIGRAKDQIGVGDYHVWEPKPHHVIPLTVPCAYGFLPLCPYGKPGDLLWVREAWNLNHPIYINPPIPKSLPPDLRLDQIVYAATECDPEIAHECPMRPSIHMPRWASRLTLRLTDVRVQRVSEITEGDAQAEGARPAFSYPGWESVSSSPSYRWGFHELWDSINAGRGFGWDANPWVWVLSFDVLERNVDDVMRDAA